MPPNTNPIFSLTPHVGRVTIPQTNAVAKSTGTSSGAGVELLYCVFEPGANGSWLSKIRFNLASDTASTASTATCLRVFLTTVAAQTEGSASGETTNTDTHLLVEIAVPSLTGDVTNAALNPYDVPLNIAIPAGTSVLVCQHVAQANACNWEAIMFGGDY